MNNDFSFQAIYYVLTFQASLMILLGYPESCACLLRKLRKKIVAVKAKRMIKKANSINKKLEKYRIIELTKFK